MAESLSIGAEDFEPWLQRIVKAGFMEYVKMFREKGLPTRADEVMQDRLFHLIEHLYINRLPTESEISSVFQLNPSQSKTLLKNTISRYRTRITVQLRKTLREVVVAASREGNPSRATFTITSDNVVEQLNLIVATNRPRLDKIRKTPSSAAEYFCSCETHDFLLAYFRDI